MSPEPRHPSHASESIDGRALKGKRGLTRLINATRYSIDGLRAAWEHEDAFRLEVRIAAVLIPVALLLPVSVIEKLLLVAVVVLVLVAELLNTGIEAAVDRDSLQIDALAKRAKDHGSAAVMLTMFLAGGTWLAILLARFL
jgi:diacylglycerol kinase (ATP)